MDITGGAGQLVNSETWEQYRSLGIQVLGPSLQAQKFDFINIPTVEQSLKEELIPPKHTRVDV